MACTPEDSKWVLGQELYQDVKNVSFDAVQSGKPLHIVRVQLNPNVHFFNTNRPFEVRRTLSPVSHARQYILFR